MKALNLLIAKSIIILLFVSTSCGDKSRSPKLDCTLIKGNIQGFDGATVYLKHINAFNYHSNSVIDSSIVKSNGDFEFKITRALPLLVNISKSGKQHPVNQVLRSDPDRYYYGYCAMFFIPEPTLLLTDKSTIHLDWTVGDRLDTYTFDTGSIADQEVFYNYYSKENIGEFLRQDDGNFQPMDTQIAWNAIEQTINELVLKYGVNDDNLQNEFYDYLNTEIRLGAINNYLNWYEYVFSDELQTAFATNELPEVYTRTMKIYENSEWNKQSVEYFKMTERFVNFNINNSSKEFHQYYQASKEKNAVARKVLKPSVAEIYTNNISTMN